uniref:Protein kinase domain-containing protein n=1 Tax=Bursaphelenchus xylophilus TaxID=6326 RepID=A0A1I7SG25_BURXY
MIPTKSGRVVFWRSERHLAVRKYFDEGESIYYLGKCIVKLAALPDLNKHSAEIITTTNLGKELQIKDEDWTPPSGSQCRHTNRLHQPSECGQKQTVEI